MVLEGIGIHKMKIVKNIFRICAISLFSKFAAAQDYSAILSCGFNGSHINIAACFLDTDLKLTNNGQTAIYFTNRLKCEYSTKLKQSTF